MRETFEDLLRRLIGEHREYLLGTVRHESIQVLTAACVKALVLVEAANMLQKAQGDCTCCETPFECGPHTQAVEAILQALKTL